MNLQYVNQPVKQISQAMSQPISQSISLWPLAHQPSLSYSQSVSNCARQPVNWSEVLKEVSL